MLPDLNPVKPRIQNNPVIQMENVTKRFHKQIANDNVSLDIYPGEVLGLLGENGAGKTTLMNILYGLYQPDEGTIFIHGKETRIPSPEFAIENGIGMVHQHFMLVRTFTVTENLTLGLKETKSPFLDLIRTEERIREISNTYRFQIDPRALIWQLSVGEQQRVEILNALLREAQVLIFDEPTAVLTPSEAEDLFKMFRMLTGRGKSVIFITHKLDEAISITNRIMVLRKGKEIDTVQTSQTSEKEVTHMMVGRDVLFSFKRKAIEAGDNLLSIEHLTVKGDRGLVAVKDLNLSIRAGEILGIAGVDGNGQRELCEAITGLRAVEEGKIVIKGKSFTRLDSRTALDQGVGYIPEDRQRTGLLLDFSLWRNAILRNYANSQFCKGLFLRFKSILAFAAGLIQAYDIRVQNERVTIRTLSGGNQQKLVLARELSSNPDVLIANQPTRGLDIASIEYVHSQLINQRNMCKAVLLVSRELNEVISLSDRIVVMYGGEIAGIVDAKDADAEKIGALMIGLKS